jgi:tetratricopeptide (TPR) repeat protein
LLTREEAVIAPFLFALVGIFIYKKQSNKNLKKLLLIILPFFLILLIYIALRLTILNFENIANYYPQNFSQSIFIRIITFLRIFLIYLSLIFFPKDLHMERSINISENITFDVICGLVIISFLLIISILKFKKHPILSFGILWFLISLSIHSNVLVIKSALLYEHWLYIPLFGIFLALFYFLHQISKNKIFFQKMLIAFYIVFVILLGIRTIIRNNDWKDPITFYTKTLKYAPSSYRVLNNLGMAYAEKGEFIEAKKYYLQAIEVNKKNPIAYHNLANVFQEEKNFEEAEKLYQKAISLDENFYPAYSGLLKLYINFQKDEAAQELIKKYKKLIKN